MNAGGVAVFPADTVYGLACDPSNRIAVERLYRLKHRPRDKPSAVMFFDLSRALDALPELGPRTREALSRLAPGPATVLLPNPADRYPLACGSDPETLGVRVVAVPVLAGVRCPVLQSSANLAGGPDARRLAEVPEQMRRACDMVIDGGELPGTASTVIDLRRFDQEREWSIVRSGGLDEHAVHAALEGPFDPASYAATIREEIPAYEQVQDVVAAAGEVDARRVLELGTGTGETAARLLAGNARATLVGVDESASMLDVARRRLPQGRFEPVVGRLEGPLPSGPFDLVACALAVHHLDADGKRGLFARVRAALAPNGRFVLGDLVIPLDPRDRVTELEPGWDRPASLSDQLLWLAEAGFEVSVAWTHRDLAVLVAEPA